MKDYDAIGGTVYAWQNRGECSDLQLVETLRYNVPRLILTDPDNYRTTREFVFRCEDLAYAVALGETRSGTIWYAVMVVGPTEQPPPEYSAGSKRVGEAALEWACEEGDFEEE